MSQESSLCSRVEDELTIYDKDEMVDLTPLQCKALKEMVKQELDARRKR